MFMALVDRCDHEFEFGDISRGQRYFRQGAVHLGQAGPHGMIAKVAGSQGYYRVAVDWGQLPAGRLIVGCECARFSKGWPCKHLWATLLAMDRTGNAQRVAGSQRLDLKMIDGTLDPPDDGVVVQANASRETNGESARSPSLRQLPPSKTTHTDQRQGREKKTSSPAWQQALRGFFHIAQHLENGWQVQSEAAADHWQHQLSARQREAWYVLAVGRCVDKGSLVLELMQRETKKDGTFGRFKSLGLTTHEIAKLSDPGDRQILTDLYELSQLDAFYSEYGYGYRSYRSPVTTILLPQTIYETLLPRLAATGRLVWQLDSDLPTSEALPLVWDDGPAWQFRLELLANDKQQEWSLTGYYQRNDQRRPLTDGVMALPTGLLLMDQQLARLDVAEGAFEWLHLLLAMPAPLQIPYREQHAFLEELWSRGNPPPLELPPDSGCQQRCEVPQPVLKVLAPSSGGTTATQTLGAKVAFRYGDQEIPVTSTGQGMVLSVAGETHIVVRAAEAEAARLAELARWNVRPITRYDSSGYDCEDVDVKFSSKQLGQLVDGLLASGWQVEAEGKLYRTASAFNMEVTSQIDWFELDAKIDFEGLEVTLPQLLVALRGGEKYVELSDGSRGMLPAEWLSRYAPLADLGESAGGQVRFQPSQALLLDVLLAEQQETLRVDQKFRQFRQRLRSFTGVQPKQEPTSFQGTLRNYQREGLGWFYCLQKLGLGGCLADDMGLGKTIQVLALLEQRRKRRLKQGETRRPTLVVVPKSLIFNWIDEAARFTPRLRVADYTGSDRRERVGQLADYHLVVTTYGTLRRDIEDLQATRFDYVILDESQAIKNANSQAAKACRLLRSDHRLALTGTPIENHLGELWSLFEFLNPGMLGHSKAFAALCKAHSNRDHDSLRDLAQALAPFILRRTKTQVLQELPAKTEQTLYCDLLPADRTAYNELRDFYRAKLAQKIDQRGLKQAKIHVLEALLRLRQAACHVGLVNKQQAGQPSAKLETLLQQVREVVEEGHKALIFSQFTSLLSILRQHLEREGLVYEYLDGRTRQRKAKVERFQTDVDCPLFLISIKAGGAGLNLTAADYVFILDPWWNPAVEAQAIDRTHRIGQTRHVFAYRIIARDTVEEKVLELQQSKRELADAIISADASLLRNLTVEDLQLILS